MQRRRLLLLTSLVPTGFFLSRYLKALALQPQPPIDYRGQALKLNQLAAGIHTPADARTLVDFVADIFSDELPPRSVSRSIREKIAAAEFAAVIDPQQLIPEERVAQAWNKYVQTIAAPWDRQVTAAEIHNLRDSFLSIANLSWAQGGRTIWTVPAIYATQDNGAIAEGCRAIESVRIFWDLANMPQNLASARIRVSQGVLASDLLQQAQKRPSTATHGSYVSVGVRAGNSVEIAARAYIAKNGIKAFGKAVNEMLDEVLI